MITARLIGDEVAIYEAGKASTPIKIVDIVEAQNLKLRLEAIFEAYEENIRLGKIDRW